MEPMKEKHGGATSTSMDLRDWVRLLRCAMMIEKRLRRNFQEQFGTTLPRFDVMASLDRYPAGQNMGDLSRALLVSNGNVTAIVRHLQSEGLVVSRVDPQDGRAAIVALTKQGKAKFAELAAAHRGWVQDALADFPADKQQQLIALLDELKSSIGRT